MPVASQLMPIQLMFIFVVPSTLFNNKSDFGIMSSVFVFVSFDSYSSKMIRLCFLSDSYKHLLFIHLDKLLVTV